jgi:hypothetical protein
LREDWTPVLESIPIALREHMELHVRETQAALRLLVRQTGEEAPRAINYIHGPRPEHLQVFPPHPDGGVFIKAQPRWRGFCATVPHKRPIRPRSAQ